MAIYSIFNLALLMSVCPLFFGTRRSSKEACPAGSICQQTKDDATFLLQTQVQNVLKETERAVNHSDYHHLRSWLKDSLSQLPAQHLEGKQQIGQWDHKCGSHDETIAPHSVSPKIPRHLHFVLIQERAAWIDENDPSRLIASDNPTYSNLTSYEQLLIENMRHTIALNRMSSIHFLTDDACRHAARKWSTELEGIYDRENDIRFMSDICRAAALYWEGGYYFDDDMISYLPVSLHDDTEFATVMGVTGHGMFQSFFASSPCHPILARQMEMMMEARSELVSPFMQAAMKRESNLLGPVTLKLAWDEKAESHTQLFHELDYAEKMTLDQKRFQLPDNHPAIGCSFVVVDSSSGTVLFCSRFMET